METLSPFIMQEGHLTQAKHIWSNQTNETVSSGTEYIHNIIAGLHHVTDDRAAHAACSKYISPGEREREGERPASSLLPAIEPLVNGFN